MRGEPEEAEEDRLQAEAPPNCKILMEDLLFGAQIAKSI
jgi:hypothetical protein